MSDKKLAILVDFRGQDALSGVLRNITGVGGAAEAKMKNLTATLRDQKAELKRLQSGIKDVSKIGGPVDHLYRQEQKLKDQIEKTNKAIKDQGGALQNIRNAKDWGDKMQSSGMGNIQAGLSLAAPFALAAKSAADFESGMIDIQQKTNMSSAATAQMAQNIRLAAKAAGQLPEDLRAGVDSLMGFGMGDAQAMQMIPTIGKVATAYRADLNDVAKAGFAVYDNLKVPLNQSGKAFEIMAAAGKEGAFELKDMAKYFPTLTARAQALGQTGTKATADLAAALQITRKGAGDSEAAARNLENLMAKINHGETIKKFEEFGVDLPKALHKAYAEGKTPIEAIAQITNKTLGGNLEKLPQLFGDMQAQSAIISLIQNMKEYERVKSVAMKAEGGIDADFALRQASAAQQTKTLMTNLSNLGIIIGNRVLPIMNPLIEKAGVMIDKFGAWAEKNPALVSGGLKFVGFLVAGNLALGGFKMLLGGVIGPATSAWNAFKFLGGGLKYLKLGFQFLRPVIGFIIPLLGAISWPVWVIIGAVAALSLAWKTNFLGIREKTAAAVNFIKNLNLLEAGRNLIAGFINGIREKIPFLRGAMGDVAKETKGGITKPLAIKSPSRWGMDQGRFLVQGFAGGISQNTELAVMKARNLSGKIMKAGTIAAAMSGGAGFASAAPAPIVIQKVEIVIQGANQNPTEIAAQVELALQRLAARAQTRQISSFDDV